MRLFEYLKSRFHLRLILAGVVVLVLVSSSLPGSADLKQDLERLRQQQEQVKKDKQAKAAQVDATTATATDLTSALETVNGQVNDQASKVTDSEQRLAAAEARHDSAIEAVVSQNAAIEGLQSRVSSSAIQSFVNGDQPHSLLLEEADPNRAVRMQSLAQAVTEDGITVADQLKTAKEDLEIQQVEAANSAADAEVVRADLADQLAKLEEQKDRQESLVQQAEDRLEQQLSEAAALADLDKQLSDQIVSTNAELARQQALAARRRNPAPSSATVGFPSAADIVNAGGLWVHKSIAGNVAALVKAAQADGVNFAGGGYRNSQNQVALRQAHCGSSNYAIYQMPASSCSPPTARPGQSMHEQGLAIDFTVNGSIIASHSSPGWQWLNANAGKYGLYNLPSEPWHWSSNGR